MLVIEKIQVQTLRANMFCLVNYALIYRYKETRNIL